MLKTRGTSPTAAAGDARPGPAAVPEPQRATLVLPSDGAYDSRAWRIASGLVARGHHVTVLARSAPGLPDREDHPAGYRVLRVPVSAASGLPGPVRWAAERVARRARRGAEGGAGAGPLAGGHAGARPLAGDDAPGAEGAREPGPRAGRGPGRFRRGLASAWRLAAIALTVRSQRLASRPAAPEADLVHAMAYMGIPIGLDLGRRDGVPVVYDARDIYVHARNIARMPRAARRLFGMVERRWARGASVVMTVNRPYAEVMARRFGVPLPVIVMNCSYRRTPPATTPRRFHEALGLDAAATVVLYHGGLAPDRGIEQLVEALSYLAASTHLVLLGYGPRQTVLAEEAASARHGGRLHLLPAVPPAELLDWVASADVVAMPIQPTTLNHRLTTPNKLFEAMTAGVPVVASDLPGMAAIVRETGCGVLCDPVDPAAIASAIDSILSLSGEAQAGIRERTLEAARGPYSWEAQLEVLLAAYGRLTGRPW